LTSEKEITSTEKLLDVIRGEKMDMPPGKTPKVPAVQGIKRKRRAGRQKGVSIGVDIGYTQLRFVKVAQRSDKGWELLDYTQVPFERGIERGTGAFAGFLKAELTRYCGSAKGVNLWAMMSAANVEVQNISVPKVSKKELRNAVFWMAKQNTSFNEEETVFDFEVQGEIVEKGIEKLEVLFYAAPQKEVDEMRALFESVGFPLNGLTIAPLALQNIFRANWIPAFGKTVAALYIGRRWSRIDIFSKGNLVMTRDIKAGINSMMESLVDEYEEKRKQRRHNESPAIEMPVFDDTPQEVLGSQTVDEYSETVTVDSVDDHPLDIDHARELVITLSPDAPSAEEIRGRFGLTEESIYDMINPALDRLVRQVERTFEHYSVTMGRESIAAVYVSTAMDVYRPIIDYIGEQLNIPSDVLDPLDPEHDFVNMFKAEESSISERSAFVPVLGVALSDVSRTLNLIYTRKDRYKRRRQDWANKTVIAVFLVLMSAVFTYYLYLNGIVQKKQRSVAALEKKYSRNIQVDEPMIMKMISEVKKEQEDLKAVTARYSGIAALGEIATITPEAVKLLRVQADWGETGKKDDKGTKELFIEGVVSGATETLESSLAAYIFKVRSSPLFDKALIKTKRSEKRSGRDVLRFTMTAMLN
jgi:type IV pilus assembly protein PilM